MNLYVCPTSPEAIIIGRLHPMREEAEGNLHVRHVCSQKAHRAVLPLLDHIALRQAFEKDVRWSHT
ncbi:MAG TPA: hypothetical protein VM537_20140 [Anaerolineae bacterium]|nr:hypothetical protein [Anaerolineae bacterium]